VVAEGLGDRVLPHQVPLPLPQALERGRLGDVGPQQQAKGANDDAQQE